MRNRKYALRGATRYIRTDELCGARSSLLHLLGSTRNSDLKLRTSGGFDRLRVGEGTKRKHQNKRRPQNPHVHPVRAIFVPCCCVLKLATYKELLSAFRRGCRQRELRQGSQATGSICFEGREILGSFLVLSKGVSDSKRLLGVMIFAFAVLTLTGTSFAARRGRVKQNKAKTVRPAKGSPPPRLARAGRTRGVFVSARLTIPTSEITQSFVASGGPGGQKVNKTATKVQLRWNPSKSTSLSEEDRELVLENLKGRLNSNGEILISSSTHRGQLQNRADARARLAEVVSKALERPIKRKPTKRTKKSERKRVEQKRQAGQKKRGRRWRPDS